jgi:hypothetical protein
MADELCWEQHTSGAHCTEPKGHSGDHVAKSGAPAREIARW